MWRKWRLFHDGGQFDMIPILYESNETDFSHHGIGDLIDCTECTVTEERNGIYECELSYPITGQFYSEISVDRIIKVKANEISEPQAFRIYRTSKPINGIVKIYLQHISYDLNCNIVTPFITSSTNATTALNEVLKNTFFAHNFTATSTVSTTSKLDIKVPVSARNCLGGMEGSILDNFGGEYEFDNFTIKLHASRGEDNGVRIAYGKNLTDITAETAIDSTYTSVYPYAVDKDGNVHTLLGNSKILSVSDESFTKFAEPRTLALDLSEKFENMEITDENVWDDKLFRYAKSYIATNKIDEIKQNIEVSFVQLWQSKEYETLALLERIKMCDIVTIDYPALGVSAKAKVIKTEYDSLNEKYIKITLGEAKSNFASTLNKISNDIEAMQDFIKKQPSAMQQAIDHATQMITGGLGGYVVIILNEETGYPEEILIMDNPDKAQAINVWRFNKGGLGHSHNGYNGPFADIALTADGKINADMITTGKLNADLIKAGTIQDTSGTVTINMNTGTINMKFTGGGGIKLQATGLSMYDITGETVTSMHVSKNSSGEMKRGVIEGDVIQLRNDSGSISGWFQNNNAGKSSLMTEYLTVGSNGIYLSDSFYTPKKITVNGQTLTVLATILEVEDEPFF